MEGFLDRCSQIPDVFDQEVVLDARTGDTNGITLLEGILSDIEGRYLAADHDHRNRIVVCGRDTGHGIGQTGA